MSPFSGGGAYGTFPDLDLTTRLCFLDSLTKWYNMNVLNNIVNPNLWFFKRIMLGQLNHHVMKKFKAEYDILHARFHSLVCIVIWQN